ncbi:DUF1491 family protein [Sphingobium sp. DEHP117]|uniref:DUF1491 family protein n=1 Tax=Sphingobium sp. DEHP117 TaxID=2993436 RepID=UPI0027D4E5A1|nr:DUF1491 family protein [Sphingobium sp. DEHP117]MDQ4420585.1 DUF1491 family protein [Sphingobium sp. DEHP117]
MTARPTSRLLVQALIRATQADGGFAMVLHKGDEIAGAVLVQCSDKGAETRLFERQADFSKGYVLSPCATQSWGNETELAQYVERRLRSDPDLWHIELDSANAERLAAAIMTQS